MGNSRTGNKISKTQFLSFLIFPNKLVYCFNMNEAYIAIDIGTSSIKILEKNADGGVLRWGILERRGKPFHTSISPLDEKDATRHLKMLLEKMGATAAEAVASLPAFLVFTAIAEAADPKFIPAPPETFKLDAYPIDDFQFFLVATPKDVVEKYEKIFDGAGLKLEKLELESLSLAKTLGNSSEPTLIMDVGDRSTTLTVAQNGKPVFLEQTDFAASSGAPGVILDKVRKISAQRGIKNIIVPPPFAILNGL